MDMKALMQIAGKATVTIKRTSHEHDRVLILSMVASGYVCAPNDTHLVFTLNRDNKPSAGVPINAEDYQSDIT